MPTPKKRTSAGRKATLPPELVVDHAAGSADANSADNDVFEFINAIDEYKRTNARPFPTWTEILAIIKRLGYHKRNAA